MISDKLTATVVEVKGTCTHGHKKGDRLILNCHDTGGLCGWCYHNLFPNLQTFLADGKLPWWPENGFMAECPDPHNRIVLRIERR